MKTKGHRVQFYTPGRPTTSRLWPEKRASTAFTCCFLLEEIALIKVSLRKVVAVIAIATTTETLSYRKV